MNTIPSDLVKLELEIKDTVIAYLQSNGSKVDSIQDDEDLISGGYLDSFDVVSLISELETKYNKNIDLSRELGDEFKMSVIWLSKVFSR